MPEVTIGHDGVARCSWDYPAEYRWYHDDEWGRPVVDDRRIYEKLCLEGFQSGLSWLTILRRRESFRRAFAGFDIEAVAVFDERDLGGSSVTLGSCGNRGKIEATIANARAALELRQSGESLAALIWQYEPVIHARPRSSPNCRQHCRVDRAVEGPPQAWVPLRRTNNRVRGDAGLGRRQRPFGRLCVRGCGRCRARRPDPATVTWTRRAIRDPAVVFVTGPPDPERRLRGADLCGYLRTVDWA